MRYTRPRHKEPQQILAGVLRLPVAMLCFTLINKGGSLRECKQNPQSMSCEGDRQLQIMDGQITEECLVSDVPPNHRGL